MLDPELVKAIEAIAARGGIDRTPRGLYWDARHPSQGGAGRVETFPGSPSQDHYRLVDSVDEAQWVLDQGELPIVFPQPINDVDPARLSPSLLSRLQQEQYAAPGGEPMFILGTAGQMTMNPKWRGR